MARVESDAGGLRAELDLGVAALRVAALECVAPIARNALHIHARNQRELMRLSLRKLPGAPGAKT